MWANCVAWLVYAFLTRDPYVLASNVPGVLIASYMAISCYGIAEDKVCLHAALLIQSSSNSPPCAPAAAAAKAAATQHALLPRARQRPLC
jgi:hypothetical protein